MFDKKIDPYKRYGIKCQKCGERVWLEYRVYDGKKEIKTRGDIPRNLHVKFKLNTRQNKELLNMKWGMGYFIDFYWKSQCKKLVRKTYGIARHDFKEKMILCDKCLKLERLKE